MCNEMKDLISLYIDNELPPDKKAEVERHIKNCADCKDYYVQLSEIITELNGLPQISLPENFHAEAIKRIKMEQPSKNLIFMSFARYASVAAGLLFFVTLVSVIGSGLIRTPQNSGGVQAIETPAVYGLADAGMEEATGGGIKRTLMFAEDEKVGAAVQNTARVAGKRELVIKSYHISIETEAFDEAIQIINNLNGSTQSSSIQAYGSHEKNANMEIKFSLQNYDFAIEVLKTLGTVQKQNEYAQVLKYDYQDAEARLSAKEAERQRLLELFAKTSSMANMLMLERRLIEVENEADMYRSELVNYNKRAENPSIYIVIYEKHPVEIKTEDTDFSNKVRNSFIASLNMVGASIENLLVFSAGLLIPVVFLALVGLVSLFIHKKAGKKGGGGKT